MVGVMAEMAAATHECTCIHHLGPEGPIINCNLERHMSMRVGIQERQVVGWFQRLRMHVFALGFDSVMTIMMVGAGRVRSSAHALNSGALYAP